MTVIDAGIGSARPLPRWLLIWLALFFAAAVMLGVRAMAPWLFTYPAEWVLPIDAWLNTLMDIAVLIFKPLFRALSWLLDFPMHWSKDLLLWLPWPTLVVLVGILAHAAGGRKLAWAAVAAMAYMLITGYWDESMVTLSLVSIAVPISAAVGLLLGLWGAGSARVRLVLEPTLDAMQTIPTFAYLTPLILFLGYGPVVGLIASVIFAIPPMVRNVMVGIAAVPDAIVESGRMSGCTPNQMTWWVKVPAAMPSILMGLNQCVMAALSMVIIAAIIGGFADIGWEVLSTMRRAEFGPSLIAGLVIALLAILLDRIGRGFAARASVTRVERSGSLIQRYPHLAAVAAAVLVTLVLGFLVPDFWTYPDAWTLNLGDVLNLWLQDIVLAISDAADALKNFVLFTYLLPIRIGLEHSVRANYWGFDMSPTVSAVYLALIAGFAALAARRWGWQGAFGVVVLAAIYYFGTTGLPWPAVIVAVTLFAYSAGGRNLALFAGLSLLFILVAGAWTPAMWSVYLMMGGVGVAFALGTLLGIWASTNDRVSAVLSAINDVLQTMPQFVYLIPIIMLFKIGDFSALLAIISYAIVPAIRYTELGLRSVPPQTVEAARMMGSTPRQILFQVKLPLALPQILLGLNQTIMLGFTMLVIAAMVGTRDLGQALYGAMMKANFGLGFIYGGSIALLAMVSDRILQAVSAKAAKRLGLGLKVAG